MDFWTMYVPRSEDYWINTPEYIKSIANYGPSRWVVRTH